MKKKIDNRIRILIENGNVLGHRTLIALVGDKSRDQVVYLHHMLSKTSLKQASVLWCYKKELAFSSHRKKRMKQLKAKVKAGQSEVNEDDPFEMFVSMTDIRYCYYKETHKILGNTFKMCVLQDFEALTPNLLCRTMETVEGGGIIIILMQSVTSLRQLYTLSMDVHSRYRTELHHHVVPRFNERFILSLASCSMCIVLDDQLRILPISSHVKFIEAVNPNTSSTPLTLEEQELKELKDSLKDNPPLGNLVGLSKTLDQAKAVLHFVLAVTEKTMSTTVTLTAARGRGKSAALGLAIAGAIAFGYSNIFVTSPSPENVNTVFEFVLKGLKEMNYEEHLNYQVLRSTDPQHNKCVLRVTVTRDHRQIVQYISPRDIDCLIQAELVVIDEAAAIPLPIVRQLLGPYLIFMASTVSGYEGTGRSLSLKLIDQLRSQAKIGSENKDNCTTRVLQEVTLNESIRYKSGDAVEKWLLDLLCLEAKLPPLPSLELIPSPEQCQLFFVNRDTLFGYHKTSEKFLSSVMGLLVSSHYRNTPDDLQTLSDAPNHLLFTLLPPKTSLKGDALPPIFCVVQVALEGKIGKASVLAAMSLGEKPAGDLIPWTVSNQFQNYDFPQLSGGRIVRVATHPMLQGKGYGSQTLKLLEEYYATNSHLADVTSTPHGEESLTVVSEQEIGLLEEKIHPSVEALPLLLALSEREPEALHYLGVSYGATPQLFTFWKRCGFTVVYLSQVPNAVTGEHSMIMLKVLGEAQEIRDTSWLAAFWFDYRKRIAALFSSAFHSFSCKFVLSILTNSMYKCKTKSPSFNLLKVHISKGDLARLQEFTNRQCDASLICDIIPHLARLYFLNLLPDFKLKPVQAAILCGLGIQRKSSKSVAEELGLELNIVLSQLHILIQNITLKLKTVYEFALEHKDDETEEIVTEELQCDVMETQRERGLQDRAKVKQLIDVKQFGIKMKEQEFDVHNISSDKNKRKKCMLDRLKKMKKSSL